MEEVSNESQSNTWWLGSIVERMDQERERVFGPFCCCERCIALITKAFDVFGPFCCCERCVDLNSWHGGWLSLKCWIGDAATNYGCLKGNRKVSNDHPKWKENMLAAKALKDSKNK
jgi:hypothetical protein